MISGFLLYRAFCAAAFAGRPPPAPRLFFRRRALRIVPAYWIALTGTLLFQHATTIKAGLDGGFGSFTATQLLSLYSLTHIYSQHWFYAGMSQSWTLAVEITFYLMLPAYALLMRKLGAGRDPDARLRLELTGAAALYLVSLGWRTLVFYGGVLPRSRSTGCRAISTSSGSAWRSPPCTRGRRRPVGISRCSNGSVATPTSASPSRSRATSSSRSGSTCRAGSSRSPARAYARNFLHSLVAVFVLVPAVFGPQDRSLFRRFLRWRPWCTSASCRTACTSGTTTSSSRRASGPASRVQRQLRDAAHHHARVEHGGRDGQLLPRRAADPAAERTGRSSPAAAPRQSDRIGRRRR